MQTESFTSFLIWIPFIYFSSLIAVARTFKTVLNSSGESGHPCLVPDFSGNAFNFSPLRIMFAVGLSYIAFIMLRYVPSINYMLHLYYIYKKKVHLVKAMVFPVVMYGCESWTIKKAEHQRIDAFELWCWRRLLRVPWTARRSNQSILKEVSPGCSLEGLMWKLKFQYFGHLM